MTLWTAQEAAAATGGQVAGDWDATGVSIDTRTIAPGDLFVALKAARDGHDFVAQALGYALICDVAEAAFAGDVVEVHQSLRHGQRRAVHCPMPVVLTVGRTASPARSPAFVRMRDGEVVLVDREIHVDEDHARWTHQPAKARPKRITAPRSADPLERLNAIVS